MPAVGAAIGAFASSVATAVAGSTFLNSIVGRLLISVAASALLQAMAPKPKAPGIRTEVTQTGGVNPVNFLLGRYATAGTRACPPMSHGTAGKTPNAYLTEVIEISDVPGLTLSRLMINDEYVTLGSTPHADYGLPVQGKYLGYAWIKFYDGSQTVADPMLLAKYGSYPERPWQSDMIGRNICYAILTCRYNRSVWNATPRFKFEVDGIPLYDPRKDTTVGGSGSHRWANKATWQTSLNPMVMAYNIMRGVDIPSLGTWGGGFIEADLPLAAWFTAQNECDVLTGDGAAGTEAQYRAGYEVTVDMEPADALAELFKASAAQIAEIGGIWKPRVGSPGAAVFAITDGDVVVSEAQDLTPFPGFTASYNAVHASYPEPAQVWADKEAPPLYNATWEAEDQGQRLTAALGFPAAPYGAQVRRLMASYIAEERRFRRHGLPLPPDAAILEPLDAISWTSAANGYSSKVFEISEITDDLMTGLQQVALRERDAADFVSSNPAKPASASIVAVVPAAQSVPGFAVSGTNVPDATGAARRPALKLQWDGDQDDPTGIAWEVRVAATGVVISRGSTQEFAAGEMLLAEGILPSTAYEARAILVVDRPASWTAWTAATTGAILLTSADVNVQAEIPFLFQDIEVFETSQAAFQFKKTGPAVVAIMGAGASGAAAAAFGSGTTPTAKIIASGGGAGGLAIKLLNVTSLTDTYVITIGAGGLGVTPPASPTNSVNVTPGNAGGASSFVGPGISMTASGGQPGQGAGTVNSSAARSVSGGLGGTAIGGDVNYPGGRGGDITTVVVNNVVRGASGGGGQNMGLAQGSPDAQDLLNITSGNHLGIRGDAIPVATRQMSTAPVPWMYYSDFNFSGREGLVATAVILLGQVNDITEFATGTGGAATVAPNASDRQSSADAGPGLCFIFYLKTNAFN